MHVVQFTSMADFVADLTWADRVGGIYHNLHEQRIAWSPQYGSSEWLLVSVIRATVATAGGIATGGLSYTTALTIPHGQAVGRLNGKLFSPDDRAREPERWRAAQAQHDLIIAELSRRLALTGLDGFIRAGIVDVPADTSLVYAADPLAEEVVTE